MTRCLIILSIFIVSINSSFSKSKTKCRDMIVLSHKVITGQVLDPQSFSTSKFSDFNYEINEFNSLSPEEQNIIYKKIRPIRTVANQYFVTLTKLINQLQMSMEESEEKTVDYKELYQNLTTLRMLLITCDESD